MINDHHSNQYKILIVQRRMTHYRVPFFLALKEKFSERGIELRVANGMGTKFELLKEDVGVLEGSELLKTRYWCRDKICWQPFRHLLFGVDMVIVTQENKLINNYFTQFLDRSIRFAYWGHGANLQGNSRSLNEYLKRKISRYADWWFGYTEVSVPLIEKTGFPRSRITVLNNSIDLSELTSNLASLSASDRTQLRNRLGLAGRHVAAYIGSLYADKYIEFMLQAALRIRDDIADFEFIIIGDGPQREIVEIFCQENKWAKYLGMKKGIDKASLLSLAQILIHPGGLGLGILDSFACGLPLVTTDTALHGPEIAYLNHGVNGVITQNDLGTYVATVSSLLKNDELLQKLREGCLRSANIYSIDNMATKFVEGAAICLEGPVVRFSA